MKNLSMQSQEVPDEMERIKEGQEIKKSVRR